MATETAPAAQAEIAAPATSALPENTSAAAAKFVAAKEKSAAPKVDAAAPVTAKPAEKQRPRIDPNLVKREREATESLQRAQAIEAKFKPLTEALAQRNFRKALDIMAQDHNATFADFVEVLTATGDESVEAKAERIARETIEKAKAADAQKAEAEQKERSEAEAKAFEEKLGKFRERLQSAAEGDPQRWKQTSVTGTGEKAWEAIEAFHDATSGGRLDEAEALDVVEESWDLVNSHFAETKQRLGIDKAIRLVIGELAKLGAEGARAKLKDARNPIATGKARTEADEHRQSGRADEPRINNRTSSGAPGVRPVRDPNAPVRFDKSAVNDAIARVLPHLASA